MKKAKQSRSVEVLVEGRTRKISTAGGRLEDILTALGFSQETMLITVDGKVTLPSSKIPSGKIELFKVVSGG